MIVANQRLFFEAGNLNVDKLVKSVGATKAPLGLWLAVLSQLFGWSIV